MTSSSIQDVSGVYYSRRTKAAANGTDQAADISGMFQNAMNMAKDQGISGTDTNQAATERQSISGDHKPVYGMTQNVSRTYPFSGKQKSVDVSGAEKSNTAGADRVRTKETSVKDTDAADATDTQDKIVKEIADKLEVSEDDVKAAMEELGLSFTDLSIQSNVALLVTQLAADGDSTALLTDADLFATIQELGAELADLLEGMTEVLPEESVDAGALEEAIQTAEEPMTQNGETAGTVTEADDAAVTYEIHREDDEDGAVDEADRTDAATEDGADTGAVSEDTGKGQTAGTSAQSNGEQTDGFSYASPFGQAGVELTGEIVPEQTQFSSGVNVQDIIDQIAEQVKINQSQNFSEIEISLHPASLGNVHLQVTEKAGVISAVITTENEAVRDALAVQAITLKEELNEQGLKVDSVEVTVASHSFEHNMQKESGEEAREQYEQQVNRQSRRRIMLSGLEEAQEMLADETLSDAERIQIDMMSKNGGSMDVMA